VADGRRKRRFLGELRASQVITTFGPGAVVDLPTLSVVVAGTDLWPVDSRHVIDEPRLRAMMRVKRFYRPPVQSDRGALGVPSFVFPRYLVCPRCSRLGPHDRPDLFRFDGRRFRCTGKHDVKVPKLGPVAFPARFVVACSEGHLDDFPWSAYVHRGKSGCAPEQLTFRESRRSGAIGDLSVHCETCDRSRTLEDAFGEKAEQALGPCGGHRPWLGDEATEQCGEGRQRTVLRGASNLFFPYVQSAISIPDWDHPIHAAIAHHEEALQKAGSAKEIEVGIEMGFLPGLEGFDPAEVFSAIEERRSQEERRPTAADLLYQEFQVLRTAQDPRKAAEREFQTEDAEVPGRFSDLIDHVTIVRRLREVRALGGFSRIDSAFDLQVDEEDQERFRIQELSPEEQHWRPAIELRGEGVFVALKEERVGAWEASAAVRDRSEALARTHASWRRERDLPEAAFPGARYVLLHSLSHLLINQMSLDCGYSSTSLRERIYSSSEPGTPMAGMLLYTATPDSDGSLGGLADQGKASRLGPLLTEALERAGYCSSDPLCAHSAPGELGHLNGAACHACMFVSETSCERANRYLDRAHVVETLASLSTNYFEGP
jgi:hypothetical protein